MRFLCDIGEGVLDVVRMFYFSYGKIIAFVIFLNKC
nr:MAG TPA: hypothetical protein [Caudoviricetes sp.]